MLCYITHFVLFFYILVKELNKLTSNCRHGPSYYLLDSLLHERCVSAQITFLIADECVSSWVGLLHCLVSNFSNPENIVSISGQIWQRVPWENGTDYTAARVFVF